MRHSLTGTCYNENGQITFVDIVISDGDLSLSILKMQKEVDKYTSFARYNLVLSSTNGRNMNQNFLYR